MSRKIGEGQIWYVSHFDSTKNSNLFYFNKNEFIELRRSMVLIKSSEGLPAKYWIFQQDNAAIHEV